MSERDDVADLPELTPDEEAWDRYVESALLARRDPTAGLDALLARVERARRLRLTVFGLGLAALLLVAVGVVVPWRAPAGDPVAAPEPAAPVAPEHVVAGLDFEDDDGFEPAGTPDGPLPHGSLVAGPPRDESAASSPDNSGSQCLRAEADEEDDVRRLVVRLSDQPVAVQGDDELRFACWSAVARELRVSLGEDRSAVVALSADAAGRWTAVSLPIRRFAGPVEGEPDAPPQPPERVDLVAVLTADDTGEPFYIDDLTLVRPGPAPPEPSAVDDDDDDESDAQPEDDDPAADHATFQPEP